MAIGKLFRENAALVVGISLPVVVVVFFLLVGGALTLNISSIEGGTLTTVTTIGLMPYVAFALLAGYASREFMLKMKDVAGSLFALSNSG